MDRELAINGQRAELILQELLRIGKVDVDRLAKQLNVSPSTIRRALRDLEQEGLLRRTHGGAVSVEPALYEPFRNVSSFSEQEQKYTAEKRRIGLTAAQMIVDGEIVAIGAGTTTTQVARSLRHRKNITVVTNALNAAMELSHRHDLKVFVSGGFLSAEWFALVGPAAAQSVSEFFVDKVFIGVDGVHAANGLTTNYPDQAAIHRQMLKQARQRIVVADHRKLGVTGASLIWPSTEIDWLITDKGAKESQLAPFKEKGVKIKKV